MARSIEELREDEESGRSLTPEEQARLAEFYAQIEAEEEAYLTPFRAQQAQESKERASYLMRLEALLEKKHDSLQRLEKLVQEIEALQKEETQLRTAVHG
jgi:GTP1/Obg family GTP-binding protein